MITRSFQERMHMLAWSPHYKSPNAKKKIHKTRAIEYGLQVELNEIVHD